jgi:hypothetical protein
MSTIAVQPRAPAGRPPTRLLPRLVAAELLKLRKRRGLLAATVALTVGASLITYAVLAILHSANPDRHGPAGGLDNLIDGVGLLSMVGALAALLVGATAGAGDLNAGVFRELVVTGRSRLALFAARIPGGLLFLLPFAAIAYTLAGVASVVFAGNLAAPSATLLAELGAWLLLFVSFQFLLALGLASLLGSRTMTVGILLLWNAALTPLFLSYGALGDLREAIPMAALGSLAPGTFWDHEVQASTAGAVFVIGVWLVVSLGLGAWRTRTRDA